MRKNRLAKNTVSSFLFQITAIVCGLILPRLILRYYGSEVNGLVNSITQFLGIISFLELGVGAVVQSSLYNPLAEKDNAKISRIVVSAGKFFRKIAIALSLYIVFLIFFYPKFAKQNFEPAYTGALILAISISFFAQYYFGVVDGLLLSADQKGYVQYTAQTVTLIVNTVLCCVLITAGASIHAVKLTTSVVYLARPVFLRLYVRKHYRIDRKIAYDQEPIGQKWNGVAQHISAVVLDGTDHIVLTVFDSLTAVSVYSVYHLVLSGIRRLTVSLTGGVQSLLGELWAKNDTEELHNTFGWFEWALHTGVVFVFGCTGMLILPFVKVYTKGIADADYIQPVFAVLMTLAQAWYCLRLPYNVMILAAGHYKQTQSNYIVAAALNIVVSVVLVHRFGLIGVAVGTLCAMLYQTVWMAVYNSKFLLKRPFSCFAKQIAVDLLCIGVGVAASCWWTLQDVSYWGWIWLAVKVALVWALVLAAVNSLFYREKVGELLKRIKRKFRPASG